MKSLFKFTVASLCVVLSIGAVKCFESGDLVSTACLVSIVLMACAQVLAAD